MKKTEKELSLFYEWYTQLPDKGNTGELPSKYPGKGELVSNGSGLYYKLYSFEKIYEMFLNRDKSKIYPEWFYDQIDEIKRKTESDISFISKDNFLI